MLPATKKEENELKLSFACTKGKTIFKIVTFKYVNLIDKRHGSRILKETASQPNYLSYKKFTSMNLLKFFGL